MNVFEALDAYSYGKQAANGDIAGECPSIFDVEGFALWNAWNDKKGMSTEESMRMFIEKMEPVLARFGIPITEDQAAVQKDYDECVKRKEKEGQTL